MNTRPYLLWETEYRAVTKSWSGENCRYVIQIDAADGRIHCTCPSFTHRGKCKHATEAAEHFISSHKEMAA